MVSIWSTDSWPTVRNGGSPPRRRWSMNSLPRLHFRSIRQCFPLGRPNPKVDSRFERFKVRSRPVVGSKWRASMMTYCWRAKRQRKTVASIWTHPHRRKDLICDSNRLLERERSWINGYNKWFTTISRSYPLWTAATRRHHVYDCQNNHLCTETRLIFVCVCVSVMDHHKCEFHWNLNVCLVNKFAHIKQEFTVWIVALEGWCGEWRPRRRRDSRLGCQWCACTIVSTECSMETTSTMFSKRIITNPINSSEISKSETTTVSPNPAPAHSSANPANSELAALFECPVCFDYVLPPILQCQNGHLVCQACRQMITSCPTCRIQITSNIRNLQMEKLASTILFPCKYSNYGCVTHLLFKDKAAHEESCNYRPYSCPCPGKRIGGNKI